MEYIIIAEETFEEIVNTVNFHLKSGWVVSGGLCFCKGMTAQAMTRACKPKKTTRSSSSLKPINIVNAYNEHFMHKNVTKKLKPNARLFARLQICINKEFNSKRDWISYFELIEMSDFLMGKIPPRGSYKQFKLSLDYIVNDDNISKILEGKFNNE